jgi:FkbM family methyltransferase
MSAGERTGVPPRILFYSHDGRGLGHVRMMLPIASEIAGRHPDAAVLLITGSPIGDSFARPPNLERVRIPSKNAAPSLAGLLPAPGSGYTTRGLWAMRESLIHETVRSFDPHILVSDNLPSGLLGELERAVRTVASASPKVGLALVLTDVPNDPDMVSAAWRSPDGSPIASLYDRWIVLGCRDVFDPVRACNFPPEAAGSTDFCGYPRPARGALSEQTVRARLGVERSLVVVAVGGGELGAPVIDTYLQALEQSTGEVENVTSLIVTGPYLPAGVRTDLAKRSEKIGGVHLVDFLDDFVDYLAAADVVVTRGGYNTVSEAVGLGKATIVIPHDDSLGEQRIRAEGFAALGLVRCILPSELTPELLTEAIRNALRSGTSPPDLLDFRGLECAAAIIDAMIDERKPLWKARALKEGRTVTKRLSLPPGGVTDPDRAPTDQPIATAWDRTRFYVDCVSMIESDIADRRGFEIELQKEMAVLVMPGDNVIDCGANIGSHACPLARRVGPAGLVLAVEPVPYLVERLEANRTLNELDNLIVVQSAVSSSSGRRTFNAPLPTNWNQGAGSFHWLDTSEPAVQVDVETTTIDELARRFSLTNLRLLKLDVEGHEMDALLGASEVLSSFRPNVYFEYHRQAWNAAGWKLADASHLLTGRYGYNIVPMGLETKEIKMVGAWHPGQL